jgi:hypothetical protein
VHHKQGRVRALYDYYPYGLMWSNVRDDQYDNTFEGSEFAHGEWGISGLNPASENLFLVSPRSTKKSDFLVRDSTN